MTTPATCEGHFRRDGRDDLPGASRMSRREPSDPVAAEIAAIAAERQQRTEAKREEFKIAWARRLETEPSSAIHTSIKHSHSEQCQGDVERIVFSGVAINIRRCSVTGIVIGEEL